jgi:hypothetical protein
VEPGQVFPDAECVSLQLDGGTCEDVIQALLRAPKTKTRNAHIAMHMHLAVSAANDVDIAGYIAQFETHRAGNIKRAVKTA